MLLPVLMCSECRDFAEPEAKANPDWRSRLSPEMIEGIRLASERSPILFAQFQNYRKSVKPEAPVTVGVAEARKLIIDSSEMRAFDYLTTHSKFKDFQAYVEKATSQTVSASNGKKADYYYWEEGTDFFLTANVKERIGELHSELKYLIETAPSNWTNSELIYVCNVEINEFGNDVTYLSPELDAEERAAILGATEAVYQNLPAMINANRGMEESRTKGLFGNIMGSWILHMAIITAAIIVITLVVVSIAAGPAAALAILALEHTITVGVLGTFQVLSAAVWSGITIGTVMTAAMAGINHCLDQNSTNGLHYAPCDT